MHVPSLLHRLRPLASAALLLALPFGTTAGQHRLASPDGSIVVTIDDTEGLRYSVTMDERPVLASSRLGLAFADNLVLGPSARITAETRAQNEASWTQPHGKRRSVPDRWRELRLTLQETENRTFGLVVRAYDNGIALRYDLPESSRLGTFRLESELTEFAFTADHRAWVGTPNVCAEGTYPDKRISETPRRAVLPLLAELPHGYAALAEADLLDWAGMFLAPVADHPAIVRVDLDPRRDKQGAVLASTPILSPWRVILLGRQAGDLLASDLIDSLATPSRVADESWIHPGITAWDPWWAGSLNTRGTTETHKAYIDLAAKMGWPYMLVDWGWAKDGDVTRAEGVVNIPELLAYAKARGVRLWLWMHHRELDKAGADRAFASISSWGVAGVKIDFMNSDSQETVRWYVDTLEAAARHRLMINFHGAYKPTGLARTYPHYLTQEGVLGNEYHKLGAECSLEHSMILPFTRSLLGPMDYTPGGFQNRTPAIWTKDAGARPGGNCEVLGTRARELALSVIYPSPLLCLADSPRSYLGADLKSPEPGLEFYRGLPTVWDETRVLAARVGEYLVMARRSGTRWWLVAMTDGHARTLDIALDFLAPAGPWSLHSFADTPESATDAMRVAETTRDVTRDERLTLTLAPGGGFAAQLSPR